MNRRVFLKGIGGASVAAPFLPSVWERTAKAATTGPAKRLVIFYTHNGCLTDKWFPKVTNGPLTADSITGGTLEALKPYVSKLLVPTLQEFDPRLTFLQGDIHLGYRLILPTKLTEDSNEVRAGRPKIVVLPEGLPKVCLGLLKMLPAGLRVLC